MSDLRGVVQAAALRLEHGPHPEGARRDAETLLMHVLRKDHAWLIAHDEEEASQELVESFESCVERRLNGEPIQYIIGEQEFFGLPFLVTQDVLIPRPETEHLVEKAIAYASQFEHPRILDVGTGSGAIAIALAHHLPDAVITATDISTAALAVARKNAKLNQVGDRVNFIQGDLLLPVDGESFDIIVSNPPYVPDADRASLSVEVRDHEPALALFAGGDGLAVYRRLIPAAYDALISGGLIALEIGYGQWEAVQVLLSQAGFERIEFAPDLQGIPRVASACKA